MTILFHNDPPTIPVWALVSIDHKGAAGLIYMGPKGWWDDILMGDSFMDVLDARLPEGPGIFWWHGHFRPNKNAGRALPNGEIDDWAGDWVGKWTEEPTEHWIENKGANK